MIRDIFADRMVPMTLKGLEAGMKDLVRYLLRPKIRTTAIQTQYRRDTDVGFCPSRTARPLSRLSRCAISFACYA